MIDICMSITDRHGTYAKFVGTTILSVLANTHAEINLHLLHDKTLTIANREKITKIMTDFSQNIYFYNVEELQVEKIDKAKQIVPELLVSRFSLATMYRLLMPEILPAAVARCIYLDADIICHLDIQELWDNYRTCYFAAAGDTVIQNLGTPFDTATQRFADRYFNAGVLLIDLDDIRHKKISLWDDGLDFLHRTGIVFMTDQDVLNYFFQDEYEVLPDKYNKIVKLCILNNDNNEETYAPAIYHYSDHMYTLLWRYDKYSRLFWYYFMHTPFFDVNFMECFLNNMDEYYRGMLRNMVCACIAKKRIFLGHSSYESYVTDKLGKSMEEPYISIDKGKLELNLDACKESMIFVFCNQYMEIKNMLSAHGLREDKDFIDGRMLIQPQDAFSLELMAYIIERRKVDYPLFANA